MIEFPEGTLYPLLEHYGWDLGSPRMGWHTVKCGAHKDSKASCRVNDEIGAAKCQACDFGGDLIKIVRYYEGEIEFNAAVKIIEEATGRVSERVSSGSSGRTSRSPVSPRSRNNRGDSTFVSPRLRGSGSPRRR